MLNHLLTWITPILNFLGLELIMFRPSWIFFVSPVLLVISFYTLYKTTGRSLKGYFWRYLISPLMLVLGSIFFISILEGRFVKHFIAFVLSLFLAVFLENMYVYWHAPKKFQNYSMLNISSYVNIVIVFLFSSSAYWLYLFIAVPLWLLAPVMYGIFLLLTYQVFSVGEFRMYQRFLYMLVLPAIGVELFLVETFLPTSVYINATILTLVYYVMIGIGKNELLGMMNKKTALRYLLIFGICILFILATAKYV